MKSANSRRPNLAPPFLFFAAALLCTCFSSVAAGPAVLLTVDRDNVHKGSGDSQTRMVKLEINVRNAATNTLRGDLEWYVVSSPIGAFGYYISGQGKDELKLPPLQASNIEKMIPRFVEKQVNAKGGTTTKVPVAEVTGYIVRVVKNGKVLIMRAAPPFIERKAGDPGEFKQLLSNSGPK